MRLTIDDGITTRRIYNVNGGAVVYEKAGSGDVALSEWIIPGGVSRDLYSAPLRDSGQFHRHVGSKRYELVDHLGSVRSVITDVRIPVGDSTFRADVRSVYEYDVYGMMRPTRTYTPLTGEPLYRYGFQGMRKAEGMNTLANTGNEYMTAFRLYDSRLGTWLTQDPIMQPVSPYEGLGSNPVSLTDPWGLETGRATSPERPGNDGGGSSFTMPSTSILNQPLPQATMLDALAVGMKGPKSDPPEHKSGRISNSEMMRIANGRIRKSNGLPTPLVSESTNQAATQNGSGGGLLDHLMKTPYVGPALQTVGGGVLIVTAAIETEFSLGAASPLTTIQAGYGADLFITGLGGLTRGGTTLQTTTGEVFKGTASLLGATPEEAQAISGVLETTLNLAFIVKPYLRYSPGPPYAGMEPMPEVPLATEVAQGAGKSVIGPRATYRQYAKDIGAEFLDVTDDAWTWTKNEEFLRGIVRRGDDVYFAGKFDPASLDKASVLAREINYLESYGYQWTNGYTKMTIRR